MKFYDEAIEKLDVKNIENFKNLIIKNFCGKRFIKEFSQKENDLLIKFMECLDKCTLSYEQFNEILLMLDQNRINKGFFDFCFEDREIIGFKSLKKGIVKFRTFAMLCFGNFKFAYKKLHTTGKIEILKELEDFTKDSREVQKYYKKRSSTIVDITKIEKEKVWFTGYISHEKLNKELDLIKKQIEEFKYDKNQSEDALAYITNSYIEIKNKIEKTVKIAEINTDIYLTWEYIDVYIATSMRNKWEFEETYDFLDKLFNIDKIKKLNLRYFNPTLSKIENRIEKGLIEGLMLKRAKCLIYMAQENDTMGKDSELAATLVQGKPVIAYVPQIEIESFKQKIFNYPLDYYFQRFLILQAEGIFNDDKCLDLLTIYNKDFSNIMETFFKQLLSYQENNPLTLIEENERNFKVGNKHFKNVCHILSVAEKQNFNRRAELLKSLHPLSIQVSLNSGVANGVLVVRSYQECADLLNNVLTNKMEFEFNYKKKSNNEEIIQLIEKISRSPFRVITDNIKLQNAFWNFYLN